MAKVKLVEVPVTEVELVEAQGGDPSSAGDHQLWVHCPSHYDENSITAEDIINDDAIEVSPTWGHSGPGLDEIMESIDAQVVDGMRVALRNRMFVTIRRGMADDDYTSSDDLLAAIDAMSDVGILVADMRKRVAETEDMVRVTYPLAEVWRGWVEDRHKRPYEFTSSVVRRGKIGILFSSDSAGEHPMRFAQEMDRAKWKMGDGSEIPWDALDPQPVDGDGEDEIGWANDGAWEAWDDVVDGAVGDDNGTKYTLYRTENGDVLMIPDGMVYVGEGSDENPDDFDDPDAYFSWPKNTIAKVDDPRTLGWEIGSIMLGDAFDVTKPKVDEITSSPYWNTLLIYVYPPGAAGRGWSMTWKWAPE